MLKNPYFCYSSKFKDIEEKPNIEVGFLDAGPWRLDAMLDVQLYTGH